MMSDNDYIESQNIYFTVQYSTVQYCILQKQDSSHVSNCGPYLVNSPPPCHDLSGGGLSEIDRTERYLGQRDIWDREIYGTDR